MDVIVTGRRISINEDTRDLVSHRLNESVVKLKDKVIRTEVEFTANDRKGDPSGAVRCEITVSGKGPVVRASGSAEDKMIAFDKALDRLIAQLRKAADRRKQRRGGQRLADLPVALDTTPVEEPSDVREVAGITVEGDGPLVVREKTFAATPLTLAQALDEMELVGHDFFLFSDATTGLPSVVYRRKAYDYGVIHLDVK